MSFGHQILRLGILVCVAMLTPAWAEENSDPGQQPVSTAKQSALPASEPTTPEGAESFSQAAPSALPDEAVESTVEEVPGLNDLMTQVDILYGDSAAPEGMAEADAYAKKLVAQVTENAAAEGVPLDKVTILIHHEGTDLTPELKWIATTLGHHRIKFELTRWHLDLKDINTKKRLKILTQQGQSEMLASLVADRTLPKWVKTKEVVQSISGRVALGLRQFFKMPKGFRVTVIPYLDEHTGIARPIKDQLAEISMAIVLAGITSYAVYLEVAPKTAENPNLWLEGGMVAAALWRVMFGYTNRANNQLHNMGRHYRHDLGKFVPALRWSMMTMFTHSMMASFTYLMVLHQGVLGSEDYIKLIYVSLLGGFAKQLPTRILAQAERRWRKWCVHVANWGMQFGLDFFKFGALIGAVNFKDYAYWTLAGIGAVELLQRHYTQKRKGDRWEDYKAAIAKRWRKDKEWLITKWRKTRGAQWMEAASGWLDSFTMKVWGGKLGHPQYPEQVTSDDPELEPEQVPVFENLPARTTFYIHYDRCGETIAAAAF